MDMYLGGPIFHAPLYGRASIFVHGLLESGTRAMFRFRRTSRFAGDALALEWITAYRTMALSLRLYGDDIGSAFTVVPFEPGDSPHTRFNARASLGVVYKF